jgi:hypothetical protein
MCHRKGGLLNATTPFTVALEQAADSGSMHSLDQREYNTRICNASFPQIPKRILKQVCNFTNSMQRSPSGEANIRSTSTASLANSPHNEEDKFGPHTLTIFLQDLFQY